jgi:hypothetical protein
MDVPADKAAAPAAAKARTRVGPYISWVALALMTTSSVASLRPAPTMAMYGLACVFLYLLPALVFLLPTSLVSAELASGWDGGVYKWVSLGISKPMGFLAIWCRDHLCRAAGIGPAEVTLRHWSPCVRSRGVPAAPAARLGTQSGARWSRHVFLPGRRGRAEKPNTVPAWAGCRPRADRDLPVLFERGAPVLRTGQGVPERSSWRWCLAGDPIPRRSRQLGLLVAPWAADEVTRSGPLQWLTPIIGLARHAGWAQPRRSQNTALHQQGHQRTSGDQVWSSAIRAHPDVGAYVIDAGLVIMYLRCLAATARSSQIILGVIGPRC